MQRMLPCQKIDRVKKTTRDLLGKKFAIIGAGMKVRKSSVGIHLDAMDFWRIAQGSEMGLHHRREREVSGANIGQNQWGGAFESGQGYFPVKQGQERLDLHLYGSINGGDGEVNREGPLPSHS